MVHSEQKTPVTCRAGLGTSQANCVLSAQTQGFPELPSGQPQRRSPKYPAGTRPAGAGARAGQQPGRGKPVAAAPPRQDGSFTVQAQPRRHRA